MTSTLGTSRWLALVAVLLAACSTQVTTVPDDQAPAAGSLASCGPCCGKDPAAEASSTQGISADYPANPYVGKDAYANVIVGEGTVLYSLTPGKAPGFAVAERTLRDADGSWAHYYELVQVTTDPGKDEGGMPRTLREQVQAFRVIEALCAARGTAWANPQFGRGGGTQYYVPASDAAKLSPGEITAISGWHR